MSRSGCGTESRRVHILGYGNPMRGDDGLGQACIRLLERDGLPGVKLSGKFQLLAEDAYEIAASDTAVFVDASTAIDEPFSFYEITPRYSRSFTSGIVPPECVLALCMEFFNSGIRAYMLAIRGYCWDLREGLTDRAEKNLSDAYRFLSSWIAGGKPLYEPETGTIDKENTIVIQKTGVLQYDSG